jgi:rhodanese-related sulfurtransferase
MSVADHSSQIEIDPERVAGWLAEAGGPDAAGPQVIDVREPYEREAGHIAGSRHVPLVELSARADTVERARPVIFYCRVGARSEMAAQAFRAAGYEAYSMRGGLRRWAQENRPLSPEDGNVADH